MRFIKDRYFSDPEISPDNQLYFTLAAYNAGPAKIRKMRYLAKKHGYDPNVWFKNVEIMTRKYVSREPVTYVTNINRYFCNLQTARGNWRNTWYWPYRRNKPK